VTGVYSNRRPFSGLRRLSSTNAYPNRDHRYRNVQPSRNLIMTVLATGLLTAAVATAAQARQDGDRELVRRWAAEQRTTLAALDAVNVRTTVRHAVNTGSGERVAVYAANLTLHVPAAPPPDAPPDGPPGRIGRKPPPGPPPGGVPPGPRLDMRLLWMTLDGDTLQTPYARRVLHRLRGMLRPNLTRLLDDAGIPAAFAAGLQPTGPPALDRMAGQSVLRVDAVRTGPGGPPSRVSLFFDESGSRLIASRAVMPLPGGRRLTASTEYDRVGGLDLPVSRVIEGEVPVPRRARVVTILLDHRTRFSSWEFRFKDD
jgi:hypothetical protein